MSAAAPPCGGQTGYVYAHTSRLGQSLDLIGCPCETALAYPEHYNE